MENGTGRSESEQVFDAPGLTDKFSQWLNIFVGAGAQATAETVDQSIPFANWCCIPFVALIVIGDMALQFWAK